MRTRYGISPWIDTFPRSRRPDHPRLRGEHAAEVVIIGGGLTGCATAYACAVAGLKPILIEADRIGQGSAGRGAGLLLPEPGPSFRDIAKRHGLRAARRMFESWRRRRSMRAALIRRLRIRCDLEACRRHRWSRRATMDKGLRRENRRARGGWTRRAVDAAGERARQATPLDAAGAIRLGAAFTLDPYRACLGLAAAAHGHGRRPSSSDRASRRFVRAPGRSRSSLTEASSGLEPSSWPPDRDARVQAAAASLQTCASSIRADRASARRDAQTARRSTDVTISDTASPRHRVRWTRDGRLLVTGADRRTRRRRGKRDAVLVQRTGQLMYELLMMNPAISGLAARVRLGGGLRRDRRWAHVHRSASQLPAPSVCARRRRLAGRRVSRGAHAGACGQRRARTRRDEVFGWTR